MKNDTSVNSLKVCYVYREGKGTEAHIFELVPITDAGKTVIVSGTIQRTRTGTSYCGMTAYDIRKADVMEVKDINDLPAAVEAKDRSNDHPICPVCLEKWKADPRSPYYQFIHGQKLK